MVKSSWFGGFVCILGGEEEEETFRDGGGREEGGGADLEICEFRYGPAIRTLVPRISMGLLGRGQTYGLLWAD